MGAGIAAVALTSGIAVTLVDVAEDVLGRARNRIDEDLHRRAAKGEFRSFEIDLILNRLTPAQSFDAFAGATFIIEAAIEQFQAKRDIFQSLSRICGAETVFATNTSSLSITELASTVSNPERVIGMHFFNPPGRMKLVEIVRGFQTDDAAVKRALAITETMGKTSILVKDTPGFIVNRVARPFYGEALRLVSEGVASVEEIDRILKLEGGFTMGPFELMDLIGVDINYMVTKSIYEQTFHEPRYQPHRIQKSMVDAGLLGRKTGRGFYRYGS